ncbi:TetR/AcrR family transcriptional regulator [Moraxellaceae bacterium AER2_44_116]|nr:TetR/AcrR family transcriptional regulator [Moraxellaceae bacterium AER2_44_116]
MNLCPRLRGRPRCQENVTSRPNIVEKAFIAFAEQGYEGVSLRQIASQCGVSDSLLHHHFGSKQQLWQEAADNFIQPLMATLTTDLETLAQSHQPAQALRQNLPLSIKNLVANPTALSFIFREGDINNERADYLRNTYMRPYLARLDTLFNQAVADQHFRPISPVARHVLILGFLRSLVIPAHLQDELAPHLQTPQTTAALIDEVATLLINGFSSTPLAPTLGATSHV